jgi:endoglucanase
MFSKSFAAVALLATKVAATIYYAGVAESSGEFGVWSQTSTKGTGLPGVFGKDYAFISKAAIDTYVDQNKVIPLFSTLRSCKILKRRDLTIIRQTSSA